MIYLKPLRRATLGAYPALTVNPVLASLRHPLTLVLTFLFAYISHGVIIPRAPHIFELEPNPGDDPGTSYLRDRRCYR
jgi:hypothetical protein